MAKVPVMNAVDQVLCWKSESEIQRMVRAGQAVRRRKAVYLLQISATPNIPTRTLISTGRSPGAAMGLSQVYTTGRRGHVDGFKTIYPEDRHFFDCTGLPCKMREEAIKAPAT